MKWCGRATETGAVVIIAGEGFAGYGRRLKALESKYAIKAPANLYLSEQPGQLSNADSCQEIVDSITALRIKPKLIIIDTLNRNFDGEENSAKDISRLVHNLDIHFKPLGTAILIVHHSGHAESGRSRGSSAIRAAMDAEFSVSKDENNITLECTKAKDFEPPMPLGFTLKQVKLNWVDDDLKPLTSVYLEQAETVTKQSKKTRLSAREQQILQSLTDALNQFGIEPGGEIKAKFGGLTFKKIVEIEKFRELAFKVIPDDISQPRVTFKRARDKFLAYKITAEYDGFIWRIDDKPLQKPFLSPEFSELQIADEYKPLQVVTENDETLQATNTMAYSEPLQALQSVTNDLAQGSKPLHTVTHFYRSVTAVTPTQCEDFDYSDIGYI